MQWKSAKYMKREKKAGTLDPLQHFSIRISSIFNTMLAMSRSWNLLK